MGGGGKSGGGGGGQTTTQRIEPVIPDFIRDDLNSVLNNQRYLFNRRFGRPPGPNATGPIGPAITDPVSLGDLFPGFGTGPFGNQFSGGFGLGSNLPAPLGSSSTLPTNRPGEVPQTPSFPLLRHRPIPRPDPRF